MEIKSFIRPPQIIPRRSTLPPQLSTALFVTMFSGIGRMKFPDKVPAEPTSL
jgi:hypothetical protein